MDIAIEIVMAVPESLQMNYRRITKRVQACRRKPIRSHISPIHPTIIPQSALMGTAAQPVLPAFGRSMLPVEVELPNLVALQSVKRVTYT